MELTDLLTYLKANKNDLPTENGFREQVHKVFMAYVKIMNAPNATVYDVYYNVEAFYDAMKATYAGWTLRNYTHALADALDLSVIKDIFSTEQLTDFSEQMAPILEDAKKCYNNSRKHEPGTEPVTAATAAGTPLVQTLCPDSPDTLDINDNEALDITTLDANTKSTKSTNPTTTTQDTQQKQGIQDNREVLLFKLNALEEENKRLKEKVTKQKKKIDDLRNEAKVDAKNATTRVWNVLITAINNQNNNKQGN